MTGAWPKSQIDHIDLDKDNNRWGNLREATPLQNNWNSSRPVTNKSGFKGVSWCRQNSRWLATIRVNGKSTYLGYWNTPERAFIAYMFAAWRYFGDFARIDADYLTAIRRWKVRKAHEHSVLRNPLVATASE
jgi:HNH endonuclease/AP2 domain